MLWVSTVYVSLVCFQDPSCGPLKESVMLGGYLQSMSLSFAFQDPSCGPLKESGMLWVSTIYVSLVCFQDPSCGTDKCTNLCGISTLRQFSRTQFA